MQSVRSRDEAALAPESIGAKKARKEWGEKKSPGGSMTEESEPKIYHNKRKKGEGETISLWVRLREETKT